MVPRSAETWVLLPLLALAAAAWSGCVQDAERTSARERGRETGLRGVALDPDAVPVDFTLEDTEGRPYRLAEHTRGHITLLFFGYTHCPDICPVHMANLAAVLRDLPADERRHFRVVFVTTDPERDTPERLRSWLDAFDRRFVGLVGSLEEVNAIQRRLGLPPAVHEAGPDGGALVGHASQVVALSRGGRPALAYPFGIRQADWAHDLPRLARDGLPGGR